MSTHTQPDQSQGVRRLRDRRGATVVEFAFVAPIAFLVIFTTVEFGRMLMVTHGLDNAARDACRLAATKNSSRTDIETQVTDRLRNLGISGHTTSITPSTYQSLEQWEPVSVRVSVPYSSVAWMPFSRFLSSATIGGTCTLPKEAKPGA